MTAGHFLLALVAASIAFWAGVIWLGGLAVAAGLALVVVGALALIAGVES